MTSSALSPSLTPTTTVGGLRLSPQSCMPWSLKKPKKQFRAIGALTGAAGSMTLIGLLIDDACLAVWSPTSSLKKIKGAPEKGLGDATSTMACHGLHTVVLLTRRNSSNLGCVLLSHDPVDPSRLASKPHDYSESLQRALKTERPAGKDKRAEKTPYSVRHTRLTGHTDGPVVVAALVHDAIADESFLLVGDLTRSVWHTHSLSAAFLVSPCIALTVPRGEQASLTVRVVRAELAPPVNRRLAVTAPSVPLALSVFDNITSAVDEDHSATTDDLRSRCLLVLEEVFGWPLTAGANTTAASSQQCFQSQCFALDSGGGSAPKVHLFVGDVVEADGLDQALNAVVTFGTGSRNGGNSPDWSCLLQLHHTSGGQELVCESCHPLMSDSGSHCGGGDLEPMSTTTLSISPCPGRSNGTRALVLLTKASDVLACEELGGTLSVATGASGGDAPSCRLMLAQPAVLDASRKARKKSTASNSTSPAELVVTASSKGARLIGFITGEGLACVTDRVCTILALDGAQFDTAETSGCRRRRALAGPVDGDDATNQQNSEASSAARPISAQIEHCHRLLTRASGAAALSPHELAAVLFRDVLPNLSVVGAAQDEARLVQACYQSFLALARCETEEDWLYLWTLTSILQRFLAHRSQAHNVCYTDRFFLDLAERHRLKATSATTSAGQRHQAAEVTHQAVRSVLSTELQKAQTARPQPIPDEMEYVLEGLCASATPLLPFAEEVVRRYAETSALSNGACVVRAKPGLASCIHVVGAALVASCLDVPMYVYYVATQSKLMWAAAQPEAGTSVHVLPQTFGSRQEFERALVMSTDLLSIASADETFRPDLVFLILAVANREHCLFAMAHLYGPLLKAELSEHAPLATNTRWMQACTALADASATPDSFLTSVFAGDARVNLSSALFYALSHQDGGLNEPLFQTLSTVLSDEYAAVVLILAASVATGRLARAQQCATAAAESAANTVLTESGRSALHKACATAVHVWAQVGRYLPYSFADLSASYAVSLAQSLGSTSANTKGREDTDVVAGTTTALRVVIMCFRLTALIAYASALEAKLADLAEASVVVPPVAELHEDAPLIKDVLDALRITVLLGGPGASPWPPAHIHTLFLRCVRTYASALCHVHPEWTLFFRRVLEAAASASVCRHSAVVVSAFAEVTTLLTSLSAASEGQGRNDQAFAHAQRCGAQAEAVVSHLLAPSVSAPLDTRRFVFAPAADATIPRWPWLAEITDVLARSPGVTDWLNAVWRLEETTEMVNTLCEHTMKRIENDSQVDAPPPRPLSATCLRPMYDTICQVLPPMRAYAVISQDSSRTPPRLSDVPRKPAQPGGMDLPISSRQPLERRDDTQVPTPPLVVARDTASAAAQIAGTGVTPPPPLSSPLSPTEAQTRSSQGPTPAVAATLAPPSSAQDHVRNGESKAGIFSPSTVAWWESDQDASRQTATTFDVSDGASSSSRSSATSYTTATTTTAENRGCTEPKAKSLTRCGKPSATDSGCARCGHCSCHHHSQSRCVSDRKKHRVSRAGRGGWRGGDEDDDLRVVRPLGASLAPRAAWAEPSSLQSANPARISHAQVLTFTRQLRAPDEPRARTAHSARAVNAATTVATRARSPQHGDHSDDQRGTTSAGLLRHTTTTSVCGAVTSPRRPQSARPVRDGALVPQLLTLTTTSRAGVTGGEGRGATYMPCGLFDARGLQPPLEPGITGVAARAHGNNRVSPFLSTATAQASRRYMEPPPLPPSSVYAAPPSLLHLRGASGLSAPLRTEATVAGEQAVTASTSAPEPSTPPSHTATGTAADARGTAVLSFDEHGVHQVSVQTLNPHTPPSLSSSQPQQEPQPPQPAAPALLPQPTLPQPTLPQPTLNPTELTDFKRYTDELIAANRGAAERARQSAASAYAVTPARDTLAADENAAGTSGAADTSSALHPLDEQKRENDFITQAQKIMAQREEENQRFYERVTESVRAISSAIEKSRHDRVGLQPAEQSALLRSSIHQKNELLNLNRELLDLQVAAARSGDPDAYRGPGLSAPHFSVSTGTTGPDMVAGGTQTSPHRPSMQDGSTMMMPSPRTSADAPGTTKTMEDTFADLRRLNAQLLNMNSSAEAMEKAIHETREAIKRYEALSSVESMNADGLALMHALQHRTAAVEQRLSSLPKPYASMTSSAERVASAGAAPASPAVKRWKSSSTVFTPYDTTTTKRAGQALEAGQAATSTPPPTPQAASPRFTSTTVTSGDADIAPFASHGAHSDDERRNTQPPPHLDGNGGANDTGDGTDTLGTARRTSYCEEEVPPPSEDSTPRIPLAFSVGGSSSHGHTAGVGRAEVVSLEALLGHTDEPLHTPGDLSRERQRSVTFQESHTSPASQHSVVMTAGTGYGAAASRASSTGRGRSLSPRTRPRRTSSADTSPTPAQARHCSRYNSSPNVKAFSDVPSGRTASPGAQPRIYNAPVDLMSVYRSAPRHPREAATRTSRPSRRPSIHTGPTIPKHAVASSSPFSPVSTHQLAPPPPLLRRATYHHHHGETATARRTNSAASALGADRFAMYAPAATTKRVPQRKATPSQLDARSLATPADADADRLSISGQVRGQRKSHASTVEDTFSARREDRRERSINQRIAMLEREFQ